MSDRKKLHARIGPRAGRRTRKAYLDTDTKQRQRQECPYCGGKAKKQSAGVFLCEKCGAKFTAGAYTVKAK